MSGLRSRDFSAKRQRLTDLSNAQKRRDLLELIGYITECGHDAAYAAELLQEAVDGLCKVHKLVGAVRSAEGGAGFGRAGGTLDLSSASPRGVDQALFAAAGAELLQKWDIIASDIRVTNDESSKSPRIWEAFGYDNQLAADAQGRKHRDYMRRVRECRVRDIMQVNAHPINTEVPELCKFIRGADQSLRDLGFVMQLRDFHLLRQSSEHACFDWHLDKHTTKFDLAVIAVLSVQHLADGVRQDVIEPLATGGVLVYKNAGVQGGDQVDLPLRKVGDCCLVRGATHYHRTVPPAAGYEVLKAVMFYDNISQ